MSGLSWLKLAETEVVKPVEPGLSDFSSFLICSSFSDSSPSVVDFSGFGLNSTSTSSFYVITDCTVDVFIQSVMSIKIRIKY